MLLIAVPAVLIFVRSRPPGAAKLTVAQAAEFLEGFEIPTAIRTRSFWLILFAQFAYFFCHRHPHIDATLSANIAMPCKNR